MISRLSVSRLIRGLSDDGIHLNQRRESLPLSDRPAFADTLFDDQSVLFLRMDTYPSSSVILAPTGTVPLIHDKVSAVVRRAALRTMACVAF